MIKCENLFILYIWVIFNCIIGVVEKGTLIIEGKTKCVYQHDGHTVRVVSKDRITAFNNERKDNLEGKAKISTSTNDKVFKFLNDAGEYFFISLK